MNARNTVEFNRQIQEMRKCGRKIISLGLGEPDHNTPDHIKAACTDSLNRNRTRYPDPVGMLDLRQAICEAHAQSSGQVVDPNQCVVTAGAKMAIFLAAAAVLRPGDVVINITPCYVSNIPILKLAEPTCTILNVPLIGADFAPDWEALEAACRQNPRLILINFPNNPSGKILTKAEMDRKVKMLASTGAVVLTDEVYNSLIFTEDTCLPSQMSSEIENLIVVNSLSKTYAMTGWRLGYALAPKAFVSDISKINLQILTGVPLFIQDAGLAGLKGPQDCVGEFVDRLKKRRAIVCDILDQCSAVSYAPIDGGMFAFVKVPCSSSDQFAADLLVAAEVAVTPGISFGEGFDQYVRVSLAVQDDPLKEAVTRLCQYSEGLG